MSNLPDNSPPFPTALLLQARHPDDPVLDHEYECFLAQTGLPEGFVERLNMAHRGFDEGVLDGIDVVLVGGAGEFSVVKGGFGWHEPMLRLMESIVEFGIPMFASCFGFQALVQTFGGRLGSDPDASELGTHPIFLTGAGQEDPIFRDLPARFDAQLGHKDSVEELPEGLVRLAYSERCRTQAVRVVGAPVVATQFHPELTREDNMTRFMRYLENYKEMDESDEDARRRAEEMHRPSPHSTILLRRFIEDVVVPRQSYV